MGCRDSDIQEMRQMLKLFASLYPSLVEENDQDMIRDFRGALERCVEVLTETNTSFLSKDEIDFLILINVNINVSYLMDMSPKYITNYTFYLMIV